MINYTASPLDSNKTLLQAFHDIETYLKNNPIYKVYTANIGYTPGTNTYMLSNINVGKNTIAENDVIFFNNAYVGIVSAVGSTEVTIKNVTDIRGPRGPAGGGAENLLKSDVTFTEAGGGMGYSILDYALNLEVGKAYKLKWDISGKQYSQTTYCWLKNEQIQLGTADRGGGGESIFLIPNDTESGVMWVVDKYYINPSTEETIPSENNASIVVTGYASTLKLISIEDAGVYIPVPTTADVDKILKVSAYEHYELGEPAGSNIISYRHNIVINNAIDTVLVFNLYNNSPDPINTVGKLIQAIGVEKGAIQINAISHENFPNYIIFYTALRATSQGDTIAVPGVRFNLSGTQPAQINSVSEVLATFTSGAITDTVTQL